MHIVDALKMMQKASGMTNADVARESGKSRQFITDAYNRSDMRLSTACKLAEAIGCDLVIKRKDDRDGVIITSD